MTIKLSIDIPEKMVWEHSSQFRFIGEIAKLHPDALAHALRLGLYNMVFDNAASVTKALVTERIAPVDADGKPRDATSDEVKTHKASIPDEKLGAEKVKAWKEKWTRLVAGEIRKTANVDTDLTIKRQIARQLGGKNADAQDKIIADPANAAKFTPDAIARVRAMNDRIAAMQAEMVATLGNDVSIDDLTEKLSSVKTA